MANQGSARDRLDFQSLCDLVFTKLKGEILDGTLRPGQKLDQTELAGRFGISRMPVRDALRKLEAEGLVTIYPEKGAFVSVIDPEEMREIYQIREVLQALAMRLAAPHLTDDQIALIARVEDQLEEASRSGDLAQWLQLDLRFHTLSYEPCENRRLLNLIHNYWNTTHQFRRAYVGAPRRMERAQAMHRRMLEAMRARDGELCARLAVEHAQESVRGILEAHGLARAEVAGEGEPAR